MTAATTAGAHHTPALVGEAELTRPLPTITAADRYRTAHLLIRLGGHPLGFIDLPIPAGGITPATLAARVWRTLGPTITAHLDAHGSRPPDGLPPDGLPPMTDNPAVRWAGPPITVVVCTRDRPDRLAACLAALDRQDYPDHEIIVVDNAPTNDAVARLLAATPGRARRVVEPRPGLARARNRGLRAAAGTVIAYLDDDERADPGWLTALADGFRAAPGVAGVAGAIVPAALDTPAQTLFEDTGGHAMGRGFTPAVFDRATHRHQHPLYPLPPFGAGGNLAFDRDLLRRRGGFDVALGAGTPARAAEDTAAISDLMLAGGTFVYWPAALVWHHHRADTTDLARQLRGYGVGLGAFYTRAVLRDPRRIATLARLAPRAVHDMRHTGRTAQLGRRLPAELRRAGRAGMLAGPLAYLYSLAAQHRPIGDLP